MLNREVGFLELDWGPVVLCMQGRVSFRFRLRFFFSAISNYISTKI